MAAGEPRDHRSQNKRHLKDPPDDSPMAIALHELAQIYSPPTSFPTATDISVKKLKTIFPYTDENTRIQFVNHYGNVFADILRFEPKVMTYNRAKNEGNTTTIIQSAIQNITEELHRVTDDEDCCLELDFVKIVFTDPKPPLSFPESNLKPDKVAELIEQRSPELRHFEHRMCLNENEKVLLDRLQRCGVNVTERIIKDDVCKIEVYSDGFEVNNHVYGGTIDLTPDDLKFVRWDAFRATTLQHTYLLSNPGSTNGSKFQKKGGDLRLKGLARIKAKQDDLEEMARNAKKTLPTYLTSANLGGLLQKDGDSKFIVREPNTGINYILMMSNQVKYSMSLDGMEFYLNVSDLKRFRFDRKTQSFLVESTASRWPKLQIPIPSKDEGDKFVKTFSNLTRQITDYLSRGKILPKIWNMNFIIDGVPTPIIEFQDVRRRIIQGKTFRKMLGLPWYASKGTVVTKYESLLDDIEEKRVVLSKSTRAKLRKVARSKKFELVREKK